jgi:LysM repeat protein
MKQAEGKIITVAKKLALTLSVLLFPFMRTYALFNDSSCGARSTAMGGAFTAVAGGPEAMCANPASMLEINSAELTAVYGRLYSGLSDNSTIGQGYFGLVTPVAQYLQGNAGFAWNDTRLSDAYDESAFSVSYATSVLRGLAAAVTLNYLRRGYTADSYTAVDPVFTNGYSKSGLGADLSLFYRPQPKYAFGLTVKNLNRPDMGLAGTDRLPTEVRAGASYLLNTSLLDLDASFAGPDFTVAAGAEYTFQRQFALRMGILAGNYSRRSVSLGLGARFGLAEFDYSFTMPISGISGTVGTHRLAFSFRFGPEAEAESAAQAAEAAELRLAREKTAAQEERIKALQEKLDEAQHKAAVRAPQAAQPAVVQSAAAPAEQTEILRQIEDLKTELEQSRAEIRAVRTRAEQKTAATRRQAKPQQPEGGLKTYVVKEGDTLESIAAAVYGDPDRWPEIYRANSGSVGRGGEVTRGQVLVLP